MTYQEIALKYFPVTGRSAVWLSASAWGAGGRRFESSRPDHKPEVNSETLAEIVRVSFFVRDILSLYAIIIHALPFGEKRTIRKAD